MAKTETPKILTNMLSFNRSIELTEAKLNGVVYGDEDKTRFEPVDASVIQIKGGE